MSDLTRMSRQEALAAAHLPGIIWIAGYPRSGVTMTRSILAHCFDICTGAVYREEHLGAGYAAAVKHLDLGEYTMPEVAAFVQGHQWLGLKTHEPVPPPAPARAIVIVRDGRSVMSSMNAYFGATCMADLIEGNHHWGSWSDWIESWQAWDGDAVWLRYGDVVRDVPGTVRRLSSWLGREPQAWTLPPFEEYRAADERIWRRGKADPDRALTPDDEAHFMQRYRSAMVRLGFVQEA